MFTLIGILSGNGLVAFLGTILIVAVICYGIKILLDILKVPAGNIRNLIWLIVAVVVIIYMLNKFLGVGL